MARSDDYWSSLATAKVRTNEFRHYNCRSARSQKRVFSRAPSWIPRSTVFDDTTGVRTPAASTPAGSSHPCQHPAPVVPEGLGHAPPSPRQRRRQQQPGSVRSHGPDKRLQRLTSAGCMRRVSIMPRHTARADARIPANVHRHFTPTPPRIGSAVMRAHAEHIYARAMADLTARPSTTPGASRPDVNRDSNSARRRPTLTQTTSKAHNMATQVETLGVLRARRAMEGREAIRQRKLARKVQLEHERVRKQEQVNAIRTAFTIIDKDGNGEVEPQEVLALVRGTTDAQGRPRRVNEATFWSTFHEFDIDSNGKINIEEFLAIMMTIAGQQRQRPPHEQPLRRTMQESSSTNPRLSRGSAASAGGRHARGLPPPTTTTSARTPLSAAAAAAAKTPVASSPASDFRSEIERSGGRWTMTGAEAQRVEGKKAAAKRQALEITARADRTVWVGQLPRDFTEAQLSSVMAGVGDVQSVTIRRKPALTDPASGSVLDKSWALVLFRTASAALAAPAKLASHERDWLVKPVESSKLHSMEAHFANYQQKEKAAVKEELDRIDDLEQAEKAELASEMASVMASAVAPLGHWHSTDSEGSRSLPGSRPPSRDSEQGNDERTVEGEEQGDGARGRPEGLEVVIPPRPANEMVHHLQAADAGSGEEQGHAAWEQKTGEGEGEGVHGQPDGGPAAAPAAADAAAAYDNPARPWTAPEPSPHLALSSTIGSHLPPPSSRCGTNDDDDEDDDDDEEQGFSPTSHVFASVDVAKKAQKGREARGLIFEQLEGEIGLRRPKVGKTSYVFIKRASSSSSSGPRTPKRGGGKGGVTPVCVPALSPYSTNGLALGAADTDADLDLDEDGGVGGTTVRGSMMLSARNSGGSHSSGLGSGDAQGGLSSSSQEGGLGGAGMISLRPGEELTGDAYIGDMMQNLKDIKQLYRSMQRNKAKAVRSHLAVLPHDPRLHSVKGRELYEEEQQSWIRNGGAEKLASDLANEEAKDMQIQAIDVFAELFSG